MKNRLSLAALCWMILASTSFAQTDRDMTTVARRQSIDWFKSANVGGPEGKMVPGVSESIFGIFDEGRQAIVLMPADLSKDGKAYYGLTWAGLFHTFEVTAEQASILEMSDGVFEVLSTSGNTFLGGEDIDERIMNWMADQFLSDTGIDLRKDRLALQRLKEVAERAKCELSSATETNINLPFIAAE